MTTTIETKITALPDLELGHPYAGLRSEQDLSMLSYVDSMACLGELPMHSGGIANTAELIAAAEVDGSARVLEIGCGTGATTRALLRAGIDVTTIDASTRMVAAMRRNCLIHSGRMPRSHVARAEAMPMFGNERFDVVLLENVFGFIADKKAAIAEMERVLAPGGRIAVTDFSYSTAPPAPLRERLWVELGLRQALTKDAWTACFDRFELVSWTEIPKGRGGGITADTIRLLLADAKLEHEIPGGERGILTLERRLRDWNRLFDENRPLLTPHNAVWRKASRSRAGGAA